MAKRKISINKKRFLCTLIVIIFLICAAFSIKNIVYLHIEQARLEEEQAELEQEKTELEDELKNVNDEDYIEEQARKQLRMVKPGEQIYILDNSSDKNGKK